MNGAAMDPREAPTPLRPPTLAEHESRLGVQVGPIIEVDGYSLRDRDGDLAGGAVQFLRVVDIVDAAIGLRPPTSAEHESRLNLLRCGPPIYELDEYGEPTGPEVVNPATGLHAGYVEEWRIAKKAGER